MARHQARFLGSQQKGLLTRKFLVDSFASAKIKPCAAGVFAFVKGAE